MLFDTPPEGFLVLHIKSRDACVRVLRLGKCRPQLLEVVQAQSEKRGQKLSFEKIGLMFWDLSARRV
jgi:hypothetical protein